MDKSQPTSVAHGQGNSQPSPGTSHASLHPIDSLSPTSLPPVAHLEALHITPQRPSRPSPISASTSAVPMASFSMSAASTPPPHIHRQAPIAASLTSHLNPDLKARLDALRQGRQGSHPPSRLSSLGSESILHTASPTPPTGFPANIRMANGKPPMANLHSAPVVPLRMKTPQVTPSPPGRRKGPGLTLSQMSGAPVNSSPLPASETNPTVGATLSKYSEFLDAKTGTLHFKDRATLDSHGVSFADKSTFSISLDEVDTIDELGKGNYGTVFKVRHARPRARRPGMGLAGNRPASSFASSTSSTKSSFSDIISPTDLSTPSAIMAMKEIRLELDDSKFTAIIRELEILHDCHSPYIINFYGAFFQEGAVYICMEFMDGGSIDKLYAHGIPENVLRKIAYATVKGLHCLKHEHNIIHRDVKPTNILINTRGEIKICDFGVSGNLVASFAKTNIGCQSYMAPERISSGGISMPGSDSGSYSVQSDIWSLGLTIIECALGRYPYPPETYNNIFSQLSAIVNGDPPHLPKEGYSETAQNFVQGCLIKTPKLRSSYPMLLQHPWLTQLKKPTAILEEDEEAAEAEAEAQAKRQTSESQAQSSQPSQSISQISHEESEQLSPTSLSQTKASQLSESLHNEPDSLRSSLSSSSPHTPHNIVDAEVSSWVIQAVELRRQGKLTGAAKPALHAAPLDAQVPSATAPTPLPAFSDL